MSWILELEPKTLWAHFDEILKIPRPSKREEAMRKYVISQAERLGVPYDVDGAGNVVIRKPAHAGCEDAPITILQSHLDMVTEKNSDVRHDFLRDPIIPRRQGEYLTATGTTLGSDNGMGVAAELAILDDVSLRHGPLELLFTVDEETGLTGAANLDPSLLKGRFLINLDTEEEGAIYVGCAGGAGLNLYLPLKEEAVPAQTQALSVRLFGLKGGHSGVDIHLQRGNAIKLLARVLEAVRGSFRLAALQGGHAHNAIPREASAVVVLPAGEREAWEQACAAEIKALQEEYRPVDPDLDWQLQETSLPERCWDEESTSRALELLCALPHGVQAMSYEIPELVETSTNLATVEKTSDGLKIHISNRSSSPSALRALQRQVAATAHLAGARAEEVKGYPGWKPNLQSPLLALARHLHVRLFGREPEVKAVHAGLECGIIGEKVPGMDMISIGPQIEYPHSPDERVRIPSVDAFYRFLCAILEEIGQGKLLTRGT